MFNILTQGTWLLICVQKSGFQKTTSFILFFSLKLQKENKLARLLEEIGSQDKMLVFVETKRKADELTRLMRRDGYPAMCIHGDKQQREREWVLGK